jgi:histidyl-tRNA synthetase
MTPTFARMVAARANALRKPVRWFSVPQLFRYERQQKGRLREHFQLNVDIVGEPDVTADAELLAVAIDIMRELGLGEGDVVARVSDRRLLRALLGELRIDEAQLPAAFAAIDKVERETPEALIRRLEGAGIAAATAETLLDTVRGVGFEELRSRYGAVPALREHFERLKRYFSYLDALGVRDWVRFDLSIVRGLAYYTGIVFELFDARGEFRAICGGGRYDNLLQALGGVDLPALGFGMGDVVLAELLRARGLLRGEAAAPDYWVASAEGVEESLVLRVAAELRRRQLAVEYTLNADKRASQKLTQQMKTASAVGAHKAFIVRSATEAEVRCLKHGGTMAIELQAFLDGTARDPATMRPVPDDGDPMTRCGSSEVPLSRIT